jgi:hypothetical protein
MPAELLYDIKSRQDSAYLYITEYLAKNRFKYALELQSDLNLSLTQSEKKAKKLANKEALTDKNRIELMEYLIASADIYSASLQYSYLKDTLLLSNSRLSAEIISTIILYNDSYNEISSLALPLCKKQKIQRFEYIDNLQDEALLGKHFPSFEQDFTDHQNLFVDVLNAEVFKKVNRLTVSGIEGKNLLELFIYMNSKEYMEQDFKAQHEIWLNSNFESGTDRARYSLWEMRNLQITANIMKACAFHPGERIIVIIGASHKGFVEKYLSQSADIELLQF